MLDAGEWAEIRPKSRNFIHPTFPRSISLAIARVSVKSLSNHLSSSIAMADSSNVQTFKRSRMATTQEKDRLVAEYIFYYNLINESKTRSS